MTTESAVPEVLHAWAIYLQASEEARRRGDRRTGTDHILLALLEDPSVEAVLGVSLQQARQALDSLDREALAALGLGSSAAAPALPMRAVPKRPRIRTSPKRSSFCMNFRKRKCWEEGWLSRRVNVKPKSYRVPEVLAQILALQPPDPAAAAAGRSRGEHR